MSGLSLPLIARDQCLVCTQPIERFVFHIDIRLYTDIRYRYIRPIRWKLSDSFRVNPFGSQSMAIMLFRTSYL